MEAFAAIRMRGSIRAYQDREVPREVIGQLIEADQWAPTPSNCQSWQFVVVEDEKQMRNLRSFTPGMIGNPPVAVVICSDQRDMADMRTGADPSSQGCGSLGAAEKIMLMAHSLDLEHA